MDTRHEKLARLLIEHSTRLQEGENLLIEAFDIPEEMILAVVRAERERRCATPVSGRVERQVAGRDLRDGDFVTD